jgi:peptidoglycan/xylan/chitin deacetylase (PgdA/CDA1 family)
MDAGNPLGNHTYGHVSLNAVSLTEYFADIEEQRSHGRSEQV